MKVMRPVFQTPRPNMLETLLHIQKGERKCMYANESLTTY